VAGSGSIAAAPMPMWAKRPEKIASAVRHGRPPEGRVRVARFAQI
jgi:hypothetical protein